MGDRGVERVTVMKSARLGYTTGLMGVLAATAAMDPGPIILLMPTDDDARGISVDWVEPLFRSNKTLRGLMRFGRLDGRNTLTRKSLAGGGSLKILSARAPRNLSRHDCRLLLCDEVDRYEVTTEGDALDLAERRTMAEPNRKIVIGSTPTDEDISVVAARFGEGSQEIFEIPCVECGTYHAPEWSNLEWENHDPATVKYMCPHCKELIDERHKPAMVYAGKWRALKPEMTSHRSFKINALVSLLPNASWATLVKEYYDAKRGGPSRMQVFHNTVLGRPWRTTINRVDASMLADRAEPWGLPTSGHGMIVPEDVMVITVGVDTQDDRVECVLIGFPIYGAPCIVGHVVLPGDIQDRGDHGEASVNTRKFQTDPLPSLRFLSPFRQACMPRPASRLQRWRARRLPLIAPLSRHRCHRQSLAFPFRFSGGFGGKRLKPFIDRLAFKRRIPSTQTNLVIEADDGLTATVVEFAYANCFGVAPLIKLDIRGINAPSDDGRPVVDAVAAPLILQSGQDEIARRCRDNRFSHLRSPFLLRFSCPVLNCAPMPRAPLVGGLSPSL
ncbi:MAG TPA: terminase gpA endonuclease subunit [Methylocella sp.]